MDLAKIIKQNKNFYIYDNKLYNINKTEALCEIQDYDYYEYGTHITYYEKGVRVENNNFGRIKYSFYTNSGKLLERVEEDNRQNENDIYMYVLNKGILTVSKDFSDFTIYKWTKYNGERTNSYNLDNILEKINNNNEQDLSL